MNAKTQIVNSVQARSECLKMYFATTNIFPEKSTFELRHEHRVTII